LFYDQLYNGLWCIVAELKLVVQAASANFSKKKVNPYKIIMPNTTKPVG